VITDSKDRTAENTMKCYKWNLRGREVSSG